MTAAPVLARTLKYKINVMHGTDAGKSHVFEQPLLKIGRGPENDLIFANDPKMSRLHAEIYCHLGQLVIRNVSQRNYILVNGEKVEEKTITGLGLVQIGETLLQIQLDLAASPGPTPAPVPVPVPASSAAPVATLNAPSVKEAPNLISKSSPTNPLPETFARPSGQNPSVSPVQKPNAQSSGFGMSGKPGRTPSNGSSRFKMYAIVAVVGLSLYWLLDDSGRTKKPEVNIRTEGDVVRAIEDSMKAVQELKKQQQTSGQDSIQYQMAQEHYLKGFRDYRQSQYSRAIQSFQAALSFYPTHELARKYFIQAQRKFEEEVDRHMSQGRKYYQRQNYRMCQSSFASVMIMVKDPVKPKYREAKQFYDECSLRLEGRF